MLDRFVAPSIHPPTTVTAHGLSAPALASPLNPVGNWVKALPAVPNVGSIPPSARRRARPTRGSEGPVVVRLEPPDEVVAAGLCQNEAAVVVAALEVERRESG
jgi:hypothetical protein